MTLFNSSRTLSGALVVSLLLLNAQSQAQERLSVFPDAIHWSSRKIELYKEHSQHQCQQWTDPKYHWECEQSAQCSVQRIVKSVPFIMYILSGQEAAKNRLSKPDQVRYDQYAKTLNDIHHQCALEF